MVKRYQKNIFKIGCALNNFLLRFEAVEKVHARKEKVKSSSQQKATYFDVHIQKGFL